MQRLPHNGFDPIVGASQLIVALQTIVSRNINPLKSAIVTVGKINGGSTWNVIPDTVAIEGTVRTFDPEVRSQAKRVFGCRRADFFCFLVKGKCEVAFRTAAAL